MVSTLMVSSLIGLKHQKQRNMQQRLSRFKKSAALALALLFCLFANALHAQWTTPNIDGSLDISAYPNSLTSDGRTWYMTWDNTNLYVYVEGAGAGNRVLMYFDTNPSIPVNGGTSGSVAGINYSNTNLVQLPFSAEAFVALETGYRQLNTCFTGTSFGPLQNVTSAPGWAFAASGDNFEAQIPWNAINNNLGRPAAFNWFGYITDGISGGNYFSKVPTANPGGILGTTLPNINNTAGYERYFKITNTNNSTSTNPFSLDCYTFVRHTGTDATSFGAITVEDFTMNTASRSITRAAGPSSWTINGALRIYQGTVNFGSNTGSCTVNDSIAIASDGTLTLSNNANALTANGHFRIDGTLNAGTSTVTFAGSSPPPQTLSGTATPTFHNITVNPSCTLSLPASFTTVVNGDFTINGTLSANSSSTVRFAGNNNTQAVSGSGTVTFGNVAVSKANSRTELVLPSTLLYQNPLHFGHSSMTINNFTLDSGLVYFSPDGGSGGTFTRTISGDVTIGSAPSSIFGNGLPLTPIRANTVLIINNRPGATVTTTVNGKIQEGPGLGYVTLILAGKDCNTGSSSTLTVNDDVTFTRPFSWNGNGTTPPSGVGTMIFNFAGDITITNSLSIFNGDRAGTGPPTINLTGSGKTVNIPPVVFLGGGPTTGGTNAQANWVISSSPSASITIPSTGALAINMGRTLTVNGTLICADGAQLIGTATGPSSGNPTLQIGANGVLKVADVDGLGDGTQLDPASNFPLFILRTSPSSVPPGNNWDLSAINTAGTIEYNGTGQTVTPRNGSNNYFKLVFSGGNKTLGGNVDVTNTLVLNGGIISTSSNDLRLNNSSATSLTRTAGHINGRLVRAIGTTSDDYLYPIGDASTYRQITLTSSASTSASPLRGEVISGNANSLASVSGLQSVSFLRYYRFTNTGSNPINVTVLKNVQVSGDDGVGSFASNISLRLSSRTTGSWVERTLTTTPNTSSLPIQISSNSFAETITASGNYFVSLATTNSGDNPLPVELLSFTATSTAQGVRLAWETASEHESRGFTLLRKKEGESAWTEVASYQTDNALRALNALNGASYSFTDKTLLEVGKSYDYQLRETGFDGQVATLETVTLTVRFNVAREYELAQNYPNPFNPVTMIRYQIPTAETVSLKVYDVLGKEVATLVSGRQEAGNYAVPFNAAGLSSGMYFYRLQAGSFVETRKMMLVK